jgi:glutamate synthase (NADPH/NADH) large chain
MGGYSLAHAMMMLIPEAWESHTLMDEKRGAFYKYHAAMIEPWDGPAAVAFTDGRQIGATLDRNGLRPARYLVTDDDLVVMASEAGVLPIPEERIVKKWRLQPGKMFLIDLDQGRIIDDSELKDTLSRTKPYQDWLSRINIKLDELPVPKHVPVSSCSASLLDRQQAFGYSQEDLKFILEPMAASGEEATGSMGNDSPLAVLSNRSKPLFNYFRQLFRAGDQSADRPDPRATGDVAGVLHRSQAEPARHQRDQPAVPSRGGAAGTRLRQHGEIAPHCDLHRQQVPLGRTRHLLSAGLG